jgi:MFS family permease
MRKDEERFLTRESLASRLSYYNILIIIIALGPLLNSLDSTMVTIALPTISRSFQTSAGTASWLVIAYFLVLSSVLLAFGKLGDIMGFKKVFMSGLAVFTVGSILCTIAPDIYLLIGFAILQALGAAMILAVSSAMVSTFLPPRIRGMAFGYVSTVTMLGVAVGPLFGGAITTYLGWRWIFLLNVPIGICAIVVSKNLLPSDAPTSPNEAFDFIGA